MVDQSLQAKDPKVCDFIIKLKAFLARLWLWSGIIESDAVTMFSTITISKTKSTIKD